MAIWCKVTAGLLAGALALGGLCEAKGSGADEKKTAAIATCLPPLRADRPPAGHH